MEVHDIIQSKLIVATRSDIKRRSLNFSLPLSELIFLCNLDKKLYKQTIIDSISALIRNKIGTYNPVSNGSNKFI